MKVQYIMITRATDEFYFLSWIVHSGNEALLIKIEINQWKVQIHLLMVSSVHKGHSTFMTIFVHSSAKTLHIPYLSSCSHLCVLTWMNYQNLHFSDLCFPVSSFVCLLACYVHARVWRTLWRTLAFWNILKKFKDFLGISRKESYFGCCFSS